jgi:ubiquinone/menaquinone biosynthesis C-methylase UbiE
MGMEVDLLRNYPKTKRDVNARGQQKCENDRNVARQFGREFFDGDRKHGYGGYFYQPRFWQPVIPDFIDHFKLDPTSWVLDVGCAKGFMLHDLAAMIPDIHISGLDISCYAVDNAMEDVRDRIVVGNAHMLPWENNSFDAVISINTIHNLERDECAQALREIERVSRGKSFITVDAYRNAEERKLMEAWNLTAKTMMHVDEWVRFFHQVGYTGDYYWFIP